MGEYVSLDFVLATLGEPTDSAPASANSLSHSSMIGTVVQRNTDQTRNEPVEVGVVYVRALV